MSLKNIQVVGFDLDGTLYKSTEQIQGRIRNRIYEKIAEQFSLSLDYAKQLFEEVYARLNSGSRTIDEIAKSNGKKADGVSFIQDALQEADTLDLLVPNQRTNETLVKLAGAYQVDLLTGSRREFAYQKLERLQIPHKLVFNFIWGKEDGDKLSGELFKRWLLTSNVPFSPDAFLYVRDNTSQDVDTPKSLGIRTCIIGKKYDKADIQIAQISDLEGILL